MKFAWVKDNKIKDICEGNPAELYHPSIAQFYSEVVPDHVERGYTLINDNWVQPDIVQPVVEESIYYPKISVTAFKLLFTSAERVAIYASADAAVKDFLSILDDPRTTEVDLKLQTVQDMMAYLVTLGLITDERKNAILTGDLV